MCINDYLKSLFDYEINGEPCFVKKHRFIKELFVIFASFDISMNDMQVFNMH
jgi:hypothetical protein